jgi:hypothetical protein
MIKIVFSLFLVCIATFLNAQTGYQNFSEMSARLKKISNQYGKLADLKSIGKSTSGKELWLLTLSKGEGSKKPAIVIVANIEGNYLAGTELSLQFAEKMLQNASKDSIAKILETKTIYIFPLPNPDATEQAFAKIKYERLGNAKNTDDDRDGKINEDPYEDLNADGLITVIRIEDATGTYKIHKDDKRVVVKADVSKSEIGNYLLISEGTDNDKDGKFNEDGEGGVHLNKNFTYDFPAFTAGVGENPISEIENRVLADFLFQAQNVYAVFSFSMTNTLSEPNKFDKVKATKKVIGGWLEKDVATNESVSKLYMAQTVLKDAPAMPAGRGDFSQWAYYHYGRLSFATTGWWLPKDTVKKNATDNDEVRFLRWADANKLTNYFVDWKTVQHPDFPNQKAEVGGIVPFARYNPPTQLLEPYSEKHLKFFTVFAWQMPELEIVNIRTETVSAGVTRITADIHNKGLLPTMAEIGEKTRWADKIKVQLQTNGSQSILAGRKSQLIRKQIAAGATEQLTWLVSGTGNVVLEVGNATSGSQKLQIPLK